MSDDDPLLALIATRPLESNNKLRAQMVADHVLAMATAHRYEDAREKIGALVLQHIQWAQREAIAKHGRGWPPAAPVPLTIATEIRDRLAGAIATGEIDP